MSKILLLPLMLLLSLNLYATDEGDESAEESFPDGKQRLPGDIASHGDNTNSDWDGGRTWGTGNEFGGAATAADVLFRVFSQRAEAQENPEFSEALSSKDYLTFVGTGVAAAFALKSLLKKNPVARGLLSAGAFFGVGGAAQAEEVALSDLTKEYFIKNPEQLILEERLSDQDVFDLVNDAEVARAIIPVLAHSTVFLQKED